MIDWLYQFVAMVKCHIMINEEEWNKTNYVIAKREWNPTILVTFVVAMTEI